MPTYLERLADRTARVRTVLCVGIDPDPSEVPAALGTGLAGVERLARMLVEAAVPHAAAVKPNLAFFEAFGSQGIASLERIRALVPPDVPVIGDAKRADIDSTAARQAVALFDALGFDAITVNPYLGSEAISPLIQRGDRFAYVLCRTSNRGAHEFQSLRVARDDDQGAPEEPLFARVARRVVGWGPGGTVGLVVGATAPDELAAVRAIAPGLPFLVPGIGAQGGAIEPVLRDGPARAVPGGGRAGGGLLANVSRAITRTALEGGIGRRDGEPAERIAAAAADWALRLPVLM